MNKSQRIWTSVGLFLGLLAAPFVHAACSETRVACHLVHDASDVCIRYVGSDGQVTVLHKQDLDIAARAAAARVAASASSSRLHRCRKAAGHHGAQGDPATRLINAHETMTRCLAEPI